jgi:hypothetical protein
MIDLLTIQTAQELSMQSGHKIPARTIRYACKNGFIKDAVKFGRDWVMTIDHYLDWVNNRPKPGRKTIPAPHKKGTPS